ncbi:MarR family winged helix-turn-helix transcriptional regulator [Corallococcus interemptor]|uniref:MarR family winged helix-turn-helix transcriptional regulator n=1 Tax=Corallococcus interemptor TaxID=2316720 RepID=UPI003D037251
MGQKASAGLAPLAAELSATYAAIYRHCHPVHTVALGHQSVRALQLAGEGGVTVQAIANHLGCAPNTASEVVRRLVEKGLVSKVRRPEDERVVEVRLTAGGSRVLEEQTGLDAGKLERRLARLPAARREAIREGLNLLLDCVEGE